MPDERTPHRDGGDGVDSPEDKGAAWTAASAWTPPPAEAPPEPVPEMRHWSPDPPRSGWSRVVIAACAAIVCVGFVVAALRHKRLDDQSKLAPAACVPADTCLLLVFDSRDATEQERNAFKQWFRGASALAEVVGKPRGTGDAAIPGAVFLALLPEESRPDAMTQFVFGVQVKDVGKNPDALLRAARQSNPRLVFHQLSEGGETLYVHDSFADLCIVLRGDWMFMATGRAALRRTLEAFDGRAPRLADDAAYRRAAARLTRPTVFGYAAMSTLLSRACRAGQAQEVTDATTLQAAQGVRSLMAGQMQGGVGAFLELDRQSDSPFVKALLEKKEPVAPGALAHWFPSDYTGCVGVDARYALPVLLGALRAFPSTRGAANDGPIALSLLAGINLERDLIGATDGTACIGWNLSTLDFAAPPPLLMAVGVKDAKKLDDTLKSLIRFGSMNPDGRRLAINGGIEVAWTMAEKPQPTLLVALGPDHLTMSALRRAEAAGSGASLAESVSAKWLSGLAAEADFCSFATLQKWLAAMNPGTDPDVRNAQRVLAMLPPLSGIGTATVESDGLRFHFDEGLPLSAVALAVAAFAPCGVGISPNVARLQSL